MNAVATTAALEQIDPTELLIDPNIRSEVKLDRPFLASIKELGVLVPVIAHRTENGVNVLMGQRRTLGAIETGRPTIPVYIVDSPEEADRLAMQLVENDRRQGITAAERANTFQQMAFLNVSTTQIAKRTGAKKEEVAQTLEVAKGKEALQAFNNGATIEQALAIAEFEDVPEFLERIQDCIENFPEDLEQEIHYLRGEREELNLINEERKFQEEAGRKAFVSGEVFNPVGAEIQYLTRPDGEPAEQEDATTVFIYIDMDATIGVDYYLDDWQEKGFTLPAAPAPKSTQETDPVPSTEEIEAEREAAREERRGLIENNKQMVAAMARRSEWLTALLLRKTAPKGYLHFVANTMANMSYQLNNFHADKKAADLASIPGEGYDRLRRNIADVPARSEFKILAMVLASYEKNFVKDCWRDDHYQKYAGRPSWQAEYLTQLESWGYQLSEVERIITEKAETGRAAAAAEKEETAA